MLVGGYLVYAAWVHFYPVTSSSEWNTSVYMDNQQMVRGIARGSNDTLFISKAMKHGKGELLQLDKHKKILATISGFHKPNGLLAYQQGVLYGEEEGEFPVKWWNGKQSRTFFSVKNAEGMASDGQVFYVIEDKTDARLFRFEPEQKKLTVLREGIDEGEGLALCPDGKLYYTEKSLGKVSLWQEGMAADKLVLKDLKDPGFLLCNEAGLWITEDATHMARLLLLDKNNKFQQILGHMRSPQAIIEMDADHYLIAEQGRNRILELFRKNSPNE